MNNQLKLFEIPKQAPKPKSKYRCRKCKHIYKHEYGKMKYCKMQKGYNTAYGDRKIKANDFGCEMFEHKTVTVKKGYSLGKSTKIIKLKEL